MESDMEIDWDAAVEWSPADRAGSKAIRDKVIRDAHRRVEEARLRAYLDIPSEEREERFAEKVDAWKAYQGWKAEGEDEERPKPLRPNPGIPEGGPPRRFKIPFTGYTVEADDKGLVFRPIERPRSKERAATEAPWQDDPEPRPRGHALARRMPEPIWRWWLRRVLAKNP